MLRTPYTIEENETESDRTALVCKDKTLAQQHYKDECDINTIADRFGLSGEMPQVLHLPTSGDFTGIFDFTSAMLAHNKAVQGFMELPARIRARFRNDPQELIDFMANPDNHDEAEFLGLVNKRTIPPGQSSPTGDTNVGNTTPPSSNGTTQTPPPARPGPSGTTQSTGDHANTQKP